MRLLLTRSLTDCESLARRLDGIGVQSLSEPLLNIVFTAGPPLDLDGVSGLLMTSANGVRAFCRRSVNRTLPVYAVGDASARMAVEAGFENVRSASGDVEALATLVCREADPDEGMLLHIAGTRVAGDLTGNLASRGYACRRQVLYDAVPSDGLSCNTATAIQSSELDGVLLYSPRTATLFIDLVRQAGLDPHMRDVAAYCLSGNVADRCRQLTWRNLRIAPIPEESELIALIEEDTGGER